LFSAKAALKIRWISDKRALSFPKLKVDLKGGRLRKLKTPSTAGRSGVFYMY
jgi:hypothetical protein